MAQKIGVVWIGKTNETIPLRCADAKFIVSGFMGKGGVVFDPCIPRDLWKSIERGLGRSVFIKQTIERCWPDAARSYQAKPIKPVGLGQFGLLLSGLTRGIR